MTTTTHELSSADIRALKKARSVSFHARWQDGELTESHIIARDRDATDNDYVVAKIDLPSYFSYGGGIVRQNADVRAYESCLSSRFHEHWFTVVGLLRAGDKLTLVWNANGGRNEIVKRAGLAVDELSVRVVRGNRQMFFHIEKRITEYNSARTFTLGGSYSAVTSDKDSDMYL